MADAAAEVVVDLLDRVVEVHVEGFGFADGDTGHEEVDPPVGAGGGALRVAFEEVDALGDDPETPQQVGPEGLGVLLLCGPFPGVSPDLDALSDPEVGELSQLGGGGRTVEEVRAHRTEHTNFIVNVFAYTRT